MGQLRSGIESLTKTIPAIKPEIEALGAQRTELGDKVLETSQRISAGLDTLVMTLEAVFKQQKTTMQAQGDKTLKEVANPAVATAIKGVMAAKADVKAQIGKLNSQQKTASASLVAITTRAKSECEKLTALAEKKKAKWLKSSKYKAKIGGYLAALKSLDERLTKCVKLVTAAASLTQDDAWLERNYKISADMKVSEIAGQASMDFNGIMSQYKAKEATGATYIRGFRDEFKDMGAQMASMSKWVSEADAMEKEAEETK